MKNGFYAVVTALLPASSMLPGSGSLQLWGRRREALRPNQDLHVPEFGLQCHQDAQPDGTRATKRCRASAHHLYPSDTVWVLQPATGGYLALIGVQRMKLGSNAGGSQFSL